MPSSRPSLRGAPLLATVILGFVFPGFAFADEPTLTENPKMTLLLGGGWLAQATSESTILAGRGLMLVLGGRPDGSVDCGDWERASSPGLDAAGLVPEGGGWTTRGRLQFGAGPGTRFVEVCRKGVVVQTPWPIEPGREAELRAALTTLATAIDDPDTEYLLDSPAAPAPDPRAVSSAHMLVMPDPRVTLDLVPDGYTWTGVEHGDAWRVSRSKRPDDPLPLTVDIAFAGSCEADWPGRSVWLTDIIPGLTPGMWRRDAGADGDVLRACRTLERGAALTIDIAGVTQQASPAFEANLSAAMTLGEGVANALNNGVGRVTFEVPGTVPNSVYVGALGMTLVLPTLPEGAVFQPVYDATTGQDSGYDVVAAAGVGWRTLVWSSHEACVAQTPQPEDSGRVIPLPEALPGLAGFAGAAVEKRNDTGDRLDVCVAGTTTRDPSILLTIQGSGAGLTPEIRALAAGTIEAVREGLSKKKTRVTVNLPAR